MKKESCLLLIKEQTCLVCQKKNIATHYIFKTQTGYSYEVTEERASELYRGLMVPEGKRHLIETIPRCFRCWGMEIPDGWTNKETLETFFGDEEIESRDKPKSKTKARKEDTKKKLQNLLGEL